MKINNVSHLFIDQIQKYTKIIILHWLAGTVEGSVHWLDKGRVGGKGTVAYYEMIGKDGYLTILGDPRDGWFHNSNKGTVFDKDTIPIALELMDENDTVTDEMIATLKERIGFWKTKFIIKEVTTHHRVYPPKPDFPDWLFKSILDRMKYEA